MKSFIEKAMLTAVTESEGLIDYEESKRYPITLEQTRKRAIRQIRKDKEN